MVIVRIVKRTGAKGGARFLFHADVIAATERDALQAATEGRVMQWRLATTLPGAGDGTTAYESEGVVDETTALDPNHPLSPEGVRIAESLRSERGVNGVRFDREGTLIVSLKWRTKYTNRRIHAAIRRAGHRGPVILRNATQL